MIQLQPFIICVRRSESRLYRYQSIWIKGNKRIWIQENNTILVQSLSGGIPPPLGGGNAAKAWGKKRLPVENKRGKNKKEENERGGNRNKKYRYNTTFGEEKNGENI